MYFYKVQKNKEIQKLLFFTANLILLFLGCSQPSINDKRKTTMVEIVNAIINNDTTKVFRLVDTSFCFEINSKDAFMANIHSLNATLSKEQIHIIPNDFLLRDTIKSITNVTYKAVFSLKKSYFDYVDIVLNFHEGVSDFVYYFNAYFRKNRVELLDNAPSGN